MKLRGGDGRDLDDQSAVGALDVVAADRERADGAAGCDGAALIVGDIAGDGAVAGEGAVGARVTGPARLALL